MREFREIVRSLFGCSKRKPRLSAEEIFPDEPINIEQEVMILTKPINPGYRRKLAVKSDYALDIRADGGYLGSEVVDGDSTAPTIADSTSGGGTVWINGDGSTGVKNVLIRADGHVGDGEVGVTLPVQYEVMNPDATVLTGTEVGADEPIPGVEPPV